MKEKYTKVSEDTIPEVGKEYSIAFEIKFTPIGPPEKWKHISSEDIEFFLDKLSEHIKATYPVSGGRRVFSLLKNTTFEPYYGVRIYYTIDSKMTDTLRDFWNEMKWIELTTYNYNSINLSSPEFYLVEYPSYWWIWLLLSAVSIGTIIALIKRKK